MTEKERELIDAGVKFAHAERNALLTADDPACLQLAEQVLEASKAVLVDRERAVDAPMRPNFRAPVAGELLTIEHRASWARGCAACALNSIDIAHTCGDS